MPTYVYRCESCEHQEDVWQKITEPHLTRCPSCAQDTFRRQLTASNFQLKGSGWYVTDFRGGNQSGSEMKKSESSKPAQETSNTTANESSASASNNSADTAAKQSSTAAPTTSTEGLSTSKSTPSAGGA